MNGNVAAAAAQPGQPGMTPGLASMLSGQAPPQTPMSERTPNVRSNPEHDWYVSLQRIRMTARDALIKSDEQEPAVKDFLTAVRGICDKLLSGGNPRVAIASGLARAVEAWAPQAAQPLDITAATIMQQMSQPSPVPGGLGAPGQPGAGPFGGQPPMGGAPTVAPGPGARTPAVMGGQL